MAAPSVPQSRPGGRMTATVVETEAPVARRVSVARAYRFELVKLLSQWRVRLLVVARALRRRDQPAGLASGRHALRPLDARHRMGRTAGDPRLLRIMGAA